MTKRLRLTINCETISDDLTHEIARILSTVPLTIIEDPTYNKFQNLYDSKGHIVGTFRLANEADEVTRVPAVAS